MNKWKVRLENTMFFPPNEDDFCYGPRWCITSPTGVSWGNKATFSEAIAYADERARTRTVVLSRLDPSKPVHKAPVLNTRGADNLWVKPSGEGVEIQHHFPPRPQGGKIVNTKGMSIPKHHLRPFALALLAHVERMEE